MTDQPTKPNRPQGPDPNQPLIDQLAAALGETAGQAQAQIRRIVRLLGPERALAFLTRTEEVEAAGGLMLPGGSRRRTKGGVYFRLVRDALSPEERRKIFPYRRPPKKGATGQPDGSKPGG